MGFKPEDTQGHMFEKSYYGLHVPSTEDYDAMNNSKLETKNKHSRITKLAGNVFADGFLRIDKSKIAQPVQDQFLDDGDKENGSPSCTSSGYNREKHGKKKK